MVGFVIMIITALMALIMHSSAEVQDYCQYEAFNVTCGLQQVIVMDEARYGRMRYGHCVKQGKTDCHQDLLGFMDKECSGRLECIVKIWDIANHGFLPCGQDYTSYLEANYHCQPIWNPEPCRPGGLLVNSTTGFISSQTLQLRDIASPRCPLIIRVPEGQKINLTLWNFASERQGLDLIRHSGSICHKYATVNEDGKEVIVCGSSSRVTNVYRSHGSQISINISRRANLENMGHFLFQFEAFGCPTPKTPQNTVLERMHDDVTIICNLTNEKWYMRCHGNSWTGEVGNCTKIITGGLWHTLAHEWTTPQGILLVVGMGAALGIVIGLSLLIVALICMRSRRPGYRRSTSTSTQMRLLEENQSNLEMEYKTNTTDSRTTDSGFCEKWGTSRSPPASSTRPPPVTYCKSKMCERANRTMRKPRAGHVYESPRFERRELVFDET